MTRSVCSWIGLVLALGLCLATTSCDGTSPASPSAVGPTAQSGPSATEFLAVALSWDVVQTDSETGASLTYVFTASATGGLGPYTFRWNFGDETPEVTGNPVTHEFARPGTYTVIVTVTDSLGSAARSDAARGTIEIGTAAKLLCFADPQEGESPLTVQFRAIMHNSIGPVTYLWDFADGRTSSKRIELHEYIVDSVGTRRFAAKATAADSTDQTLSCSVTIEVTNSGSQLPVDNCPTDPNKTQPGICGCGVADTDTDGDGAVDCIDNCPADPNKTDPGICGCGVADIDSDGDGTPDCLDGCPADPGKTQPGVCGCGVADTDSDGDGTPNCNDSCPADPNKTVPGTCGCGLVDTPGCGCPFVTTGSLWRGTGTAGNPTCTCPQNGDVLDFLTGFATSCGGAAMWTQSGACRCL